MDAPDLLSFCAVPRSREEIAAHLGLKTIYHVKKYYIDPLLAEGLLRMTLPERPKSKNQRYYSATGRPMGSCPFVPKT